MLMLSGIMYGGAWRRNYNVLKTMPKINKKIDYTLLLEKRAMKLVPNINEIIAELKELYSIRFFREPAYLKFTPLHYIYITKLSGMMNGIAKEEKVDLIYVAHEIDWWILSAKNASRNSLPWASLFQTGPFFGCILSPSPKGKLSTLMETPALAYTSLKKIKALYRYSRLQLLTSALERTLSLSVSKSITRDLKILHPKLEIETLMPGVGIDLSYISSIPASPSNFDAVYFTSELIPHKGFLELPEIWKNVVQQMPDAKLLIVGKGQPLYLQQFLGLIEKFDIKKNIVLSHLLPHSDLVSLVKSSKLMIYPSRFDAFPLVVLEALASGVPVVAYDIPAIRLNYITKSVIKCPVNDVKCLASNVVTLLSDDKLRRKLSQEAVEYAAGFSWENVARKEAEGYHKVLDFWSSK